MTKSTGDAPAGRTGAASRRIAVLIPCLDEERTIGAVVRAFRAELPDVAIYVYDNGSRDRTPDEARAAGAIVRRELRRGKGHVVQAMFRDVDADVYVLVDGDGTYPADRVHDLIAPVLAGEADMVNGSRLLSDARTGFKAPNLWANVGFVRILNGIFHVRLTDLLSGYRAFSRLTVKTLPLVSRGFEIETELTLKAIERDLRIVEVPVALAERPQGSHSKIARFRDGRLILVTILALFRDYKPLTLFGGAGILFVLAGLVPGGIVVAEFARTGLVPRMPSAILAVGLVLLGILLGFTGLVLHAIARRFQEQDRVLRNLVADAARRGDEPR